MANKLPIKKAGDKFKLSDANAVATSVNALIDESLPKTGVKTINGQSIVGTGDITITGGGGSLALGETAGTAYRGDRGKQAFDHISNKSNPHEVTKSQVGLGNVDNTTDINKPVSIATQLALNQKEPIITTKGTAFNKNFGTTAGTVADGGALAAKQDALNSGVNIKTVNSQSILGSGNIIITGGGGDPADCIYITGGGTGTNRNDNNLFIEKAQEAIENNKKLIIKPDKDKTFRLTQTLELKPPSGKNEFYLDIEAHGVPRSQIQYAGPEGSACISAVGHRFGVWSGIKIALADTAGLIAFDLDTKGAVNGQPAMDSTTHNTYINCHVALGGLLNQNQKGWRIGYESGGGGDISDLSFINTSVFGRFGAPNANDYGWQIYGGNVLQNTWTNAFTAFCGRGYSNVSDVQGKTGNGASYFYGTGTSQNLLDFEIGNSQSYLIAGGRFESGKQILHVTQGNISPAITFQTCQWDDYQGVSNFGGGSDNLFFLDMPASLSLDNCNIKSGRWDSYSNNMIKAYGPSAQGLFGSIMVKGGNIQSAGSSFINTGSDPTWVKRIDTVKRLDSQGRAIAMFDNV